MNMSNDSCAGMDEVKETALGKYIGGILLAFFGSTLESIGATIQKYAADTEDRTAKAEGREPTAYIKLKWFWVGTIVFIAGNGLDFAALAMVPAAVVVCVGSWALILNLFTASKILGEERTSSDYVAACLIIVGIVLAMSGRPIVDTVWTMEAYDACGTACDTEGLLERFQEPTAVAAILVLFILEASTVAILGWRTTYLPDAGCSSLCAPGKADGRARLGGVYKFLYVLQAALAGVITVGCGSAVGGILYSSGYKCTLVNGTEISYGNQLYGYAWLFVAVLVVSAVSQVHLIQCSFQVNDILIHIPVFYVCWQVGAATFGGIVYREYRDFGSKNWAMYITGVMVMFAGIFLTTRRMAAITAVAKNGSASSEKRSRSIVGAQDELNELQMCLTADDDDDEIFEREP